MNKILLISHEGDMDGLTPYVLAKIVFNDVDVIWAKPEDMDKIIEEIINKQTYKNYTKIIITDLGLKDVCYDLINNSPLKQMVMHFDHHQTNNAAPWSTVLIKDKDYSYSGTSIFYDYLCDKYQDNKILKKESLKEFVEAVRLYDNFEHIKYNNPLGMKLTNLFSNLDREYFIKSLLNRFLNDDSVHFNLTNEEKEICDKCDKELEDYLIYCDKNLIKIDFLGYKVGLSISTKYRSSVGNYLSEKYKNELDFILIANYERESFSLRTVNDINVGNLAKKLGGGGHEKAAGFPMNDDTLALTNPYFDRKIMNKLKNKKI